MNENHNHYWLEQTERLLHDGQPVDDALLNALASTQPQARSAFQETLETQLVAALTADTLNETEGSNPTMQAIYLPRPAENIRRMSIRAPLTLAAAVAALLIAGLVLVMMNRTPPENPELFFGALHLQETATAFRSTEEALLATVDTAMTQFADVQAQLEAAQHYAVEQTAQAAVAAPVPTATPVGSVPAFAETGVCAPQSLNIYDEPDPAAPPLAAFTADMKYEVQGTLILNNVGGEWLLVVLDAGDGKPLLRGWVLAAELREACVPDISAANPPAIQPTIVPPADAASSFMPAPTLPPLVVPATVAPFMTPLSGDSGQCLRLPLLLHDNPSRDAGIIAEVPLSHVVQVEGAVTLNTGQTWLLIAAETGGPLARGWTSADLVPAACLSIIAPEGLAMIDKMDAAPVMNVTATPIPAFPPMPAPFLPAPSVEQLADGRYRITLPVAEEPISAIQPGDEVYVLAELSYAPDRRAWTVVAQGMEVIRLAEPSADTPGGFLWMEVALVSDDEETVSLLQDMASAGVAFALELAP